MVCAQRSSPASRAASTTVETVSREARSPPAAPPSPSATTNRPRSGSVSQQSSLLARTRPTCVAELHSYMGESAVMIAPSSSVPDSRAAAMMPPSTPANLACRNRGNCRRAGSDGYPCARCRGTPAHHRKARPLAAICGDPEERRERSDGLAAVNDRPVRRFFR